MEVLVCPKCSGVRRLLAAIHDPASIAQVLLAMGLRSFSMHPSRIAIIKQRVLRADTRRLTAALPRVLEADDCAAACAELLGGAIVT